MDFRKLLKLSFLSIIFVVIFAISVAVPLVSGVEDENVEVVSPYLDVDWDEYEQLKSSFHSHTTQSDGWASVEESLEAQENYGFDVVALTDHWVTTYPWEDYVDDDYDMLSIPASEPTHDDNPFRLPGHHTVYLFTEMEIAEGVWGSGAEPRGWTLEFEEVMEVVGGYEPHPETGEEHDGIQFFAHPEWHDQNYVGRNWGWYYEYFDNYDHLIGLEILNTNANNYSEYNAEIFDKLLKQYGWDREIYALGTTDEHFYDWNDAWTVVLSPEREEDMVRSSMEDGKMFFVQNLGEGEIPEVSEISIENDFIDLDIDGNYEEVRWIFDGEIVEEGEVFDFANIGDNMNYVRFEVWGEGDDDSANIVGSQAFYFDSGHYADPPEDEPREAVPWMVVGITVAILVVILGSIAYFSVKMEF